MARYARRALQACTAECWQERMLVKRGVLAAFLGTVPNFKIAYLEWRIFQCHAHPEGPCGHLHMANFFFSFYFSLALRKPPLLFPHRFRANVGSLRPTALATPKKFVPCSRYSGILDFIVAKFKSIEFMELYNHVHSLFRHISAPNSYAFTMLNYVKQTYTKPEKPVETLGLSCWSSL